MNMKWMVLPLVLGQTLWACPIGKNGLSRESLKKLKNQKPAAGSRAISSASLIPELPTADSSRPWGGVNSRRSNPQAELNWKPEAVLANGVSSWLNRSWKEPDVVDVWVSVPVKMRFTAERVYDDGQTNASLKFGDGWNEDHPQLMAVLSKFKNGSRKVVFSFSSALSLKDPQVKITYFVENPSGFSQRKDVTLHIRKVGSETRADWDLPTDVRFGDLEKNRVLWVRPQGWDSSFPIDFRMDIRSVSALKEMAKNAKTAGFSAMDPLSVGERAKQNGDLAQTTLLKSKFGPQWKRNDKGTPEFQNTSIHGEIHENGKEVKTAVGGGLTWFVEKGSSSTFKNLYTCFEARNFSEETRYGVPSGGGWHEIGDAAETIINNMETSAVPVGHATGLPWPTPPDGTKFPWGLSDVATVRFLQPGEALVTAAGDQTWKEDEVFRTSHQNKDRGTEPSGGGRSYHWFFFQSDQPVCTQEWVHHCRPTAHHDLGLGCP